MQDKQAIRIVFLDRETLSPEIHLQKVAFPHELITFGRTSPSETSKRIHDADIVITNKVKVTAEALATASRLRLIAVAATGTDVIDLKICETRGVAVVNVRDYAVNTVPEHTVALILALRRSLLPYRDSIRSGRWQEADQFCYFDYPIRDLAGSTLGIIGDGVLGRAVAEIARGFKLKILFSAYKGLQGMVHNHGGQADHYCFKNLVELYSSSTSTQASDSGSWGYNSAGDWAVMVIGGDPISSFAVRASNVLDWARNTAFGSQRQFSVY